MLKIQGLHFYYPGERKILRDINLHLGKGEILCLLGPNGTGKTTLLRCLLGIHRAKDGKILIRGQDGGGMSSRQRAVLMAYVPQSSGVTFPYEAEEVVMMGRVAHLSSGKSPGKKDHGIVAESMERLGIGHLRHRLFQELSGGERQMVLIARAMAQQAEILIMDEPTSSLDYGNQVKILQAAKDLSGQGYGILMTSHFPDHAFWICHQVALMQEGTVVAQGAPEETVTEEALSRLYRTPVYVTATGLGVKACIPFI